MAVTGRGEQSAEPAGEQPAFRAGGRQVNRGEQFMPGFFYPSQALQGIGPGSMPQVRSGLGREGIHGRQHGRRAVPLTDRNGPVQRHRRVRGPGKQQVI